MAKKQLIIFDNHKIPRKYRGKILVLLDPDCIEKKFRYASSDKYSKNDELYVDTIDGKRFTVHLTPNSYSIKSLKSNRVVQS